MKKLITNLFLGLAIMASFQASAQYCGSSQVVYPDGPPAFNYGFGDYNTFACITRGQCDSLIIPFQVYEQFTVTGIGTVPVYKLQFNSIDSLPCGLCWSTSKSSNPGDTLPNEFTRDGFGCIKISGLTNDAAGSYELAMTLNVATSTANDTALNIPNTDSRAGGVYLWIKVIDPGQCPDTVDQTLLRHPSTSCNNTNCSTVGINEVSKTLTALTIQPNPMNNEAKVNFTSVEGGSELITITDIEGRQVYNTTMNAKAGSNTFTISKNNMQAGSYILYVGNAQGTATRKFVITE